MSTLDLAEPSYPDPVADAAFDDIHAYPSPDEKRLGAYYTPQGVAEALTQWATSDATPCDVLDPSCGDGRFLVGVERGTGIDIDVRAVEQALTRVPTACIIHTDFFSWAERTERRFDAVVGNPPFIRYQSFTAEMRERALAVCAQRGVALTGLSSSWAPFIVAAVSLLRDGGSAAFVVPSEIGHAVYARPVLEFLLARFARVEVIAIRQKLFPNLSEDCWLLRAAGWGGTAVALHIARVETFEPDVPPSFEEVGIVELRAWNLRLRPLLLSPDVRAAYLEAAASGRAVRFGSLARLGIGYVSGGNAFFHLRPSEASRLGIPRHLLRLAVRSSRDLQGLEDVDDAVVGDWLARDRAVLLLDLKHAEALPPAVQEYLDSAAGRAVRNGYKCRNRSPWYGVPDVTVPDAFLSVMSSRGPRLVANSAGAVCTNSVHAVSVLGGVSVRSLVGAWSSAITELSCELQGHSLGGGLLKLEPKEAREVLVSIDRRIDESHPVFASGARELRRWRNAHAS